MNEYDLLAKLAKSIKYQNLFVASKDLNGIRIFKNTFNFSKLQELFLNYLYTFDSIHKDIITDKISEHVLDDDTNIYWESYILWRKKNIKKSEQKDNNKKDLHLVSGKKINFKR